LIYNEIQERYPQELSEWENDLIEVSPPGGETLQQLVRRIDPFLRNIAESNSKKNILLVAHGGPLQVLVSLALGMSPRTYWQFHLSPASLSQIAIYPAGAILNLLNDTSHLEMEPWDI
jgi:ribonuclease H / adenosylcobalamin/alpha-ribazole phosphatase